MTYLNLRRLILLLFLALSLAGECNAQFSASGSKNPEKALFGKTVGHHKQAKIKEASVVRKAKKKQEKNQKKLKKEWAKSVKRSRQRTYDIQSPEVQARMKQNEKDIVSRDKAKKKNIKSSTKKAGKKYN